MYSEARKLGRMSVPSVQGVKECTGCKENSTGPEFQNLGGDSELDLGEYILFGYKEVSGPAWV